MAAPSISGVAVPSSMHWGAYRFDRGEKRINGAGGVTRAGAQSVEWTWETLTQSEFDWWATTILSGAESATVTAELWDDGWTERSFTSAVLHRPESEGLSEGEHRNVTVRITNLLPRV